MLETLRSWAMVLSGVAVFGSLCEVILPEGSFQKYIRLGLGMILVLALISPFQELLHQDFDDRSFQRGYTAYLERESMEEEQKKAVIAFYKENLNRKMQSTLVAEIPDFTGEISCSVEEEEPERFGEILRVWIQAKDENVALDEICKVLNQEYGILETQVEVQY